MFLKTCFLVFTLLTGAVCHAQTETKEAPEAASWPKVYDEAVQSIPIIFPGICSGSLISPRLILTAAHCIADARPRSLTWRGAKEVERAEVVYIDPDNDVGVLRLMNASSRPTLQILPDSKLLDEGQDVGTIGHPFAAAAFASPPVFRDMTYIFSAGVISKVNKEHFLTDLSVSPGNSGGPVLDRHTRITGITSRKVTRRRAGEIAQIVGPDAIQKVDKNISQLETANEVGFLQAQSTWDLVFSLLYSNEIEQSFLRDSPTYLGGLLYNWKDRLHLEYLSNFSDGLKVRQAGLGFKLVTSFYDKYYVAWTPLVEKTWYESGIKNQESTVVALEFKYVSIPMTFKVNSESDVQIMFELGP